MRAKVKQAICIAAVAGAMSAAAFAADREVKVDDRLDASADALTDMMRASDRGIPQDLIDKAHCVVVVPGIKKAGFIFGAKYGRGFAIGRHDGVGWTAPAAMRVEGGSVGFSDWSVGHRCRVAKWELYGHDATNREILTGDFQTPAVVARFEHALNWDSDQRTR